MSIPFPTGLSILEHSIKKKPIGVIVQCWDTLRRNTQVFSCFIDCCRMFREEGIIVISQERTTASSVVLREYIPKSIVIDKTILSLSRLFRLAESVYRFTENTVQFLPYLNVHKPAITPRFGLVVSNGYGLGHVVRMSVVARSLEPYGDIRIMSFSAGLYESDHWPIFYLPSAEYLKLDKEEAFIYTREATQRFIEQFLPTHLLYDGNVLPLGMLGALALHPNIHLTWIRRGMWQPDIDALYMVQQALVDLVIEPGDLADDYDTGPTWHGQNAFVQPRTFLKTLPIRPDVPKMDKTSARIALGLPSEGCYALLMPGASQDVDMERLLVQMAQQVRHSDAHPVIAHWPISHRNAPQIKEATVIERMPIAPYYNAFDFVISAAGYNSYHELLASDLPIIFMPQEDIGRDQQLARARYAADKGWARLCRQKDVSTLHTHIAAIKNSDRISPSNLFWLEDWQSIVQVLCSELITRDTQTHHAVSSVADCNITAFFHTLFIRFAARYQPYDTRFIFIFDKTQFASLPAMLTEPGIQNVIVTDCINPVLLRRMKLDYLWFNHAWLPTPLAMMRQFWCWLKLWRPREIIYFVGGEQFTFSSPAA